MPFRFSPTPRVLVMATAAALLTVFGGLAWRTTQDTSETFDEPGFMAAGYSYLKPGSPEIGTMNLRLSQLWVALPLLPLQPHLPDAIGKNRGLIVHAGVDLGRAFLADPRNDAKAMLRASRASVILLGLILGAILFCWSRRLHGDAAGLAALAFFCLSPVFISNSALATTDLATVLLFVLAVGALWRLMHRVTVGAILAGGLSVGALAATKISVFLLGPMVAIMLAIRLAGRREFEVGWPGQGSRSLKNRGWITLGAAFALTGVMAYLTLWAVYGFRYTAGEPLPAEAWTPITRPGATAAQKMIAFLQATRLLPEAYLFDLQTFTVASDVRRAFLLGEYSINGWWYFFPAAWFFKTPLAFQLALLLAAIGAVQAARKRRDPADAGAIDFYGLTPLWVLGGVYGAFAMVSPINIGIRHILPVYPLLFVLAGTVVRWPWRVGWMRPVLAAGLLSWSAYDAWKVHPNYLAYFNPFAGGAENGYRVLVDSSYEWGQDLPPLERWVSARAAGPEPKRPLYLSYFGNADLRRFKLDAVLLPQFVDLRPLRPYPLEAGTYVISATMLQTVYGPTFGPWRPSYEKAYQTLAEEMQQLDALKAEGDKTAFDRHLAREGLPAWRKKMDLYDYLRFNRLCAWLRQREPDERITCGLLVYQLSSEQIENALFGPPAESRQNHAIKGVAKAPPEMIDFLQ